MRPGFTPHRRTAASVAGRRRIAFSLIEVLIVMTLLSIIILGLIAMFSQTQRAFRLGMSQTDVLESGRMSSDLLRRELNSITPTYADRTNNAPNFYSRVVYYDTQRLPGVSPLVVRTNVMCDLFFMIRENQTWTGIGYFVRTNRDDDPNFPGRPGGVAPVGSLYRYITNNTVEQFEANPGGMFEGFRTLLNGGVLPITDPAYHSPIGQVSKIVDGVVEFRLRSLDPAGYTLTNNPAYYIYLTGDPRTSSTTNVPISMSESNLFVQDTWPVTGEIQQYWFYSNAVPAAVDLELGVLEQGAYDRYRRLPAPAPPISSPRTNFFNNAAGNVHVFRQRISIANVDPAAYQAYVAPTPTP